MSEPLPALAITGSTGVLGGALAAGLAQAGIPQRLLVRTPAKAPQLPGARVVRAAYQDTAETRAALAGVRTLFMVSASESEDRTASHRAFIDAAAAAGVRQVVYTSFIAAAPDAVFTLAREHYATEEHLKASGMGWTVLRDNFYADFMGAMVGDDGVIRGPAGAGRCSIVARADVVRTAAAILREPELHLGRSYQLTGPQALSMPEVAAILTEETGSAVRFVDESLEQAHASRAGYGAPAWQLDAWVSTYTAIASGALEPVNDDIERITGKPPMWLADLLRSRAG